MVRYKSVSSGALEPPKHRTEFKMTFINSGSPAANFHIFTNLTRNVGKRMGIEIIDYNTSSVKDASGSIYWMCNFDEIESRIYRVENGTQRFSDIKTASDGPIDLDGLEDQIRKAILSLNLKTY
jgi:hypothetical protein